MQFVILEHRLLSATHWDLLFEQSQLRQEGLLTWSVDKPPLTPGWQEARERRRHRRLYLRYEGPVLSAGGYVGRWDQGRFDCLVDQPDLWRAKLAGRIITGILTIERRQKDSAAWRLRLERRL